MNSENKSVLPASVAKAKDNLGTYLCIGMIFLGMAIDEGFSTIITLSFGIFLIFGLLTDLGECGKSDE